MSKLVNLRIDEGLLERVDQAAGPRRRTQFIVQALEAALGDAEAAEPAAAPPPRASKPVRLNVARTLLRQHGAYVPIEKRPK